MERKKELFLSMSDLVSVLSRAGWVVIASAILCAALGFGWFVLRPVHFTAQGIFKGQTAANPAPLLKVLEFLGSEESFFSSDDPRLFLRSYPVLEEVTRELGLQGFLSEGRKGRNRLQEIWYTLKTAYTYRRLKKERPPSPILSGKVFVPDKLILADPPHTLSCKPLTYLSSTSTALSIRFSSATTFSVKEGKKNLGLGTIDTPFTWERGSFTLSGKGNKGRKVTLYLIPMEQAVHSLQNGLHVVKDKENPALVHLSYSHGDRELAAQIVNETMERFQHYLKAEGTKKITQQLAYLRQRQEEAVEQLGGELEKQKGVLEEQLKQGQILALEQEMGFMAQAQADIRQEMLQAQAEMENLAQSSLPFAELVTHLKGIKKEQALQTLSTESAHQAILEHQKVIDALCLDCERYNYCLTKLEETDFDSSSLSKILQDPSFQEQFEKMHGLHRRLIDSKNWAAKEREQLKVELETEKVFMAQQIKLLKEGALLHQKVLQERIQTLKQNLLFLLLDSYEQGEHKLAVLAEQTAHFPEKWLAEQKIALNTKLYTEMMDAISKMIEIKNIGYNLDYLMAKIHKPAFVPVLPDPPHLLKGALIGGAIGLFLPLFGLCFYQIYKGPTASYLNLLSQKRSVLAHKECVPLLALALAQKQVVLLASHKQIPWISHLVSWLSDKGERVFVIDLTSPLLPDFMADKNREPFLASQHFQTLLETYKQSYQKILILSKGNPSSFEIKALTQVVDRVVYGICHERLIEIEPLPARTLFFIQETKREKPLSFKEIKPFLDTILTKMRSSSFSSVHPALKRILSKRL